MNEKRWTVMRWSGHDGDAPRVRYVGSEAKARKKYAKVYQPSSKARLRMAKARLLIAHGLRGSDEMVTAMSLLCLDCGKDTMPSCGKNLEYYMVHDAVWREARMRRGILCIGCLERRIGRRLNADDFTASAVNHIFGSMDSKRLASRKRGKP